MNHALLFRSGPAACLVLAVVSFLAACNTPTSSSPATPQVQRIAEHQTAYDALPATTQKQLTDGLISKGQNLKLVYVALGRPDHIVITPDGKSITWTYRNYVSPVIATNKVVLGNAPVNPLAHNTPLTDTFDAWNNNLLKHDEFGGARTSILDRVAAKAPTQSWAEYGKYRRRVEMSRDPGEISTLNKQAELDYQEALTIPPIASPDPIKLDVIFVDQQVTDAIVDDSFSAFSFEALPLSATVAPGIQTQAAP